MAINFARDYQKAVDSYNKKYIDYVNEYNRKRDEFVNNYNNLAGIYNAQREGYLNDYGSYLNTVDQYNAGVQQYYNAVDAYNANAQSDYDKYKASIDAYNASIVQDPSQYDSEGNWKGRYEPTGLYTIYNNQIIGRGNPVEQYQLTPEQYATYGYTPATENSYGSGAISGSDYFISPEGQYYRFPSRPSENYSYTAPQPTFTETPPQFTGVAPTWSEPQWVEPAPFDVTAPKAPTNLPKPKDPLTSIPEQDLYQQLFGRGTLDTLSNEAWSLNNIASPFTTNEENAYETGNMTNINNPFGFVAPDALTTGENAKDYGLVQSPFL